MHLFRRWFFRLAKRIYRSVDDSKKLESKSAYRLKFVTMSGLGLLFVVLVLPMIIKESGSWSSLTPVIALEKSDWSVYYGTSGPCSPSEAHPAQCVAAPANPTLWNSEFKHSDEAHHARIWNPRTSGANEYWLGATIPGAALSRAFESGANHLVIGYLIAVYQVWVDGTLYAAGDYRTSRYPVIIQLPMSRLVENRPVYVAVKIENIVGAIHPDVMATFVPEGLFTKEQAESYHRRNVFENDIRPTFFTGVYLILSGMFFVVWLISRRKQEYWYMGLYALTHALIQVLNIEVTSAADFGKLFHNRLHVFASLLESSGAIMLGLAFARLQRVSFMVVGAATLAAILGSQWFLSSAIELFSFQEFMLAWIIPASYAIGGFSCFAQAVLLDSQEQVGARLSVRIHRLFLFGMGLIVIGVTYFILSGTMQSATVYTYWFRYLNLGIALFISTIVLLEYHEQEKLIEETPVSPYHRRPVLPDSLSGVLLAVDLRGSEALFRLGAKRGHAGSLVHSCLTHMWRAVSKNGGTVLQTEGDMILAFFDRDTRQERGRRVQPAEAALRASVEMSRELRELSRQFHERAILQDDHAGIYFRGAMNSGEIKPVWQEVNGSRYAAWIESGTANAFVDVVRLLELERQVPRNSEHSTVIVPDMLALELSNVVSAESWLFQQKCLIAKNEVGHCVSAFAPEALITAVPDDEVEESNDLGMMEGQSLT